jgi:hypothetical protein
MKSHVSFLGIFCVAIILALIVPASAQQHYEFTPSVSVSGEYDDNIFLTPDNEVDDYIMRVTPSLALSVLTQHTDLSMRYAPSFVWYDDRDDLDNTRHLGNVTWGQQLTQHLRFDLTDTYLESEDPLEDELDVQGIRRTRNKYWVNNGRASVGYVFGAENRLEAGYSRQDRENDEITLDDSKVQSPFADLTYWFNTKNGIELTYNYTDVEYTRGDRVSINDDYSGHQPGARYIHRFSPQSNAYIGYAYTTRDFDGVTEDYDIHDGYVGLEHAFSPQYSISARGGYYFRKNDVSEDQDGPTFSASLTRNFARGSIVIGGEGGWGEEYLERGFGTTSGFTEYYGGYTRITYQIFEPVGIFAGGSYRHDKDELDVESDVVRANGGFTLTFLRWFSLTVSYTYADRNDDFESDSYTDNRVTATLTAAKPFRW